MLAVVVSMFNAGLSMLSPLIFSDHESTLMWATVYAPAILWIPAAFSLSCPRGGLIAYAVLASMVTGIFVAALRDPVTGSVPWIQIVRGSRYVIVVAILLAWNALLARRLAVLEGR